MTKAHDKIEGGNEKIHGHWNDEEHKRYVIFIDFFKNDLNSKFRRK